MLKNRNNPNENNSVKTIKSIPLFLYLLFYALLSILVIILPLLFWNLKKLDAAPFVSFTRLDGLPFELFGGLASFVSVLIAWIEIKRTNSKSLATILPIVIGLLVGINCLLNISESTFNQRFSSDYIAFESGAKAMLSQIDPYLDDRRPYVYPPLVGQVMALLYPVVTHIPFSSLENEDLGWQIIFYLFQCCQFLLIISAYFLTYDFAKRIGMKPIHASIIVGALFLFNNSVTRTLNFHQTNLWILNSFLIAFLLQKSYPIISGFALALGVHIKLYPFILILPWIAMRRWLLIISTSLGLFAIAIVQTNFGRDWTLLGYFFNYMKNVSKPTPYRNNSINSVVSSFFMIPNKFFGTSFDLVPIIVTIITLMLAAWFVIRFIKRERIYKELSRATSFESQCNWNDMFRLYGHSMDAIALGLLISPSVYEHHYIVAIPIALWAIATRNSDRLVPVATGIFLIFCVPTFDLFLISFHRLTGLLILIYFTSPAAIQQYFLKQIRKQQLR
jgi:Glycosyltransferase family 87